MTLDDATRELVLSSPAEVDERVRGAMERSGLSGESSMERTVTAAKLFAEEMHAVGVALNASHPRGSLTDDHRRVFGELLAAHRAVQISDAQRWDAAGFAYQSCRGEDVLGDLRRLAAALEATVAVVPVHAAGLVRHAGSLRDILTRSEIDAQAAARRDVRRSRLFLLVVFVTPALLGLMFLSGRAMSGWVGAGYVVCGLVLIGWLTQGRRRTEVAKRCADLGWPLKEMAKP